MSSKEYHRKCLYLSLKATWFDMIESGVKKAEYREIKPYWIKRLCIARYGGGGSVNCFDSECMDCLRTRPYKTFKYDIVRFSYGYTRRTMTFEIESITIGKGNPAWGAPTNNVFIISLGRRLS